MEERVRQELAVIVNAQTDSRLVDRLYAVVRREVDATAEAYEGYVESVLAREEAL